MKKTSDARFFTQLVMDYESRITSLKDANKLLNAQLDEARSKYKPGDTMWCELMTVDTELNAAKTGTKEEMLKHIENAIAALNRLEGTL